MRTIIVYKSPQAENPDASHTGLGITADNIAAVLTENNLPAQAIPVIDGYDLWNKLNGSEWIDVTHVIMCAPFFDTIFLRELCKQFSKVQFVIVYHSNVGFLGVDNWSTKVLIEQLTLQDQISNFRVGGNSEKFCHAVRNAFITRCVYLNNLYPVPSQIANKMPGTTLKIGAFGAIRVLKNLPTSAWAALIIARLTGSLVELWISVGREEGKGADQILNNIRKLIAGSKGRVILVESKWQGWEQFRATVRQMDLLLQPSYTESFNNVTADGISVGVPSVVGEAINWVPDSWIANVDDATEVAKIGVSLIGNQEAIQQGIGALRSYVAKGIENWRAYLTSVS